MFEQIFITLANLDNEKLVEKHDSQPYGGKMSIDEMMKKIGEQHGFAKPRWHHTLQRWWKLYWFQITASILIILAALNYWQEWW